MKKVTIQICSCSNCVMSDAMGIGSAVNSLRKLEKQLEFKKGIFIEHTNYIPVENNGECSNKKMHTNLSPVVKVGDDIITEATTDVVMSAVVAHCKCNNN